MKISKRNGQIIIRTNDRGDIPENMKQGDQRGGERLKQEKRTNLFQKVRKKILGWGGLALWDRSSKKRLNYQSVPNRGKMIKSSLLSRGEGNNQVLNLSF